eukprot:259731-Chlamydomonas_euryale.AAC.11
MQFRHGPSACHAVHEPRGLPCMCITRLTPLAKPGSLPLTLPPSRARGCLVSAMRPAAGDVARPVGNSRRAVPHRGGVRLGVGPRGRRSGVAAARARRATAGGRAGGCYQRSGDAAGGWRRHLPRDPAGRRGGGAIGSARCVAAAICGQRRRRRRRVAVAGGAVA